MIVLRLIQSADNMGLARLIRETMEEFGVYGENTSAGDQEIDGMFEAYSLPRHAYFVWDRGEEILGGGGIGPLVGGDEDTCELRKMYLHPDLRGQGKGRELLQQCLQAAKQHNYLKCYLETMEQMSAARLLYEKMGFQESSSPMGATGHQCHRWMIKSLA